MSALAISLGQKILRGGRLSKRGGQVVSYSPHIAELFGSVSRAALGGTMIVGSAIAAPVVYAVPTNVVIYSGLDDQAYEHSVTSGTLIQAPGDVAVHVVQPQGGAITLVNNGTLRASRGIETLTIGDGNVLITNNNMISGSETAIAARRIEGDGTTTVINNGMIAAAPSDGIGIAVLHGELDTAVDGDIFIRNNGVIEAGNIGIAAGTVGVGNIDIQTSGRFGIGGGQGAIVAMHHGDGNVVITNDAVLMAGQNGKGITVLRDANSSGNVSITQNAAQVERDESMQEFADIDVGGGIAVSVDHAGDGDVNVRLGADAHIFSSGSNIQISRASSASHGNTIVTADAGSFMNNSYYGVEIAHSATGDVVIDLSGSIFTGSSDELDFFSSGGCGGVYATHYGDGDINFTLNGYIDTSINGIGLYLPGPSGSQYVGTENIGNLSITLGAPAIVRASDAAIHSFNYRNGNSVINNAGRLEAGSNGMTVGHYGVGDFLITNTGDIAAVGYGINAFGGNEGLLHVTNSGTITNLFDPSYETGIRVSRSINHVTLINNAAGATIENYDTGIHVDQQKGGRATIVNDGVILGAEIEIDEEDSYRLGSGIRVTAAEGGMLEVENNGTIHVGSEGIRASFDGVGAINIRNGGTITSDNVGVSIDVEGDGRVLSDNSGDIISSRFGVQAMHHGEGDLLLSNSGTITYVAPQFVPMSMASDSGIYGYHSNAGLLKVTNAVGGLIQGFEVGLNAERSSDGDVDVLNAGTIRGQVYEYDGRPYYDGTGIYASHGQAGDINIRNTGTIEQAYDGIIAGHYGAGDININNSGQISANTGISAYREMIDPDHTGNIRIISTGDVTATGQNGILALNENGGVVITAHNVSTNGHVEFTGIYAASGTDAGVSVRTTGKVTGGYSAILVNTVGGLAEIEIGANSVVENHSGVSNDVAIIAMNDDPTTAANFRLTNNGKLTGAVDFSGSYAGDSLTFVNRGTWNSARANNQFSAGSNDITVAGVWRANGSYNDFGSDGTANDRVSIAAGGELQFGDLENPINMLGRMGTFGAATSRSTSFIGLADLDISGRVSSVNGTVGDTLYTDGDVVFRTGSTFAVETGVTGVSDALVADGVVTINGGTLEVTYAGPGAAVIGNRHTVIEAAEVIGTFANTSVLNSAFLGWMIDYDYINGEVGLTYAQVRDLRDAAATPNQRATASGIQSMGMQNALTSAVASVESDAEAQRAFNSLSGEIHAGVRTALMEDSRLSRNAVLERLNQAEGGAVWGQAYVASGSSDANNAAQIAKLDRDSWGVMAGVDLPLGEDAVAGIAAAYSNIDMDQGARSATAKADVVHALAYVGGTTGRISYKAGVGYAWGDIDTTRSVSVGSFSDRLVANYDARLFQGFAELGFKLPFSGGELEPIANITYLDSKTKGFTETGGLAALRGGSESNSHAVMTLGSRFATPKSGAFSVNGMIGWQHSFGTLTPSSTLRFASGDSFNIAGVSRSRDAAAITLESLFDLSSNTSIGVSYDGVLGSASSDHAGKVSLRIKF